MKLKTALPARFSCSWLRDPHGSDLTVVHKRTYSISCGYRVDPGKAATNYAKHHVKFADAVAVLEDDLALTIRDPGIADEERWMTLGLDGFGDS